MFKWRLGTLERFSLLSCLAVFVLALALSFVTSHVLTDNMLQWEWQHTAELVRYQVRAYSLERLFTDPVLSQDRQRFKESLSSLLTLPEVVRLKVWDKTGTVLWSDDERLVGKQFRDNDELRSALTGKIDVELKKLTKTENAYDRQQFRTLAEVYVPILAEQDPGRVVGVLEVYKVPTRLFDRIRTVRLVLWTTVAAGLVLYLFLAGIVRLSRKRQLKLEQDLQHTLRDLHAKNTELDNFVYIVSHDLKGPLVSLQGLASALIEDHGAELPPSARHYLQRIQANTEHMEQQVLDLLALSRIGREARRPEVVSVAELVEDACGTLSDSIRARGVKVITGDLGTLYGIRTHLEQVVGNLLGNAIKYLGDAAAPTVEIGMVDRGRFTECYVKDNGIGIDPAYHRKVFEIFQRLKDTEAEGTGIGLAIVKKVVEGAGGRVWVESAKGDGATFRFTWPKDPRRDGRGSA